MEGAPVLAEGFCGPRACKASWVGVWSSARTNAFRQLACSVLSVSVLANKRVYGSRALRFAKLREWEYLRGYTLFNPTAKPRAYTPRSCVPANPAHSQSTISPDY